MEKIDFDNECWICGAQEEFNVCISCGVEIFVTDNGKKGTDKTIQYLKDANPDRYEQMIKQYHEKK